MIQECSSLDIENSILDILHFFLKRWQVRQPADAVRFLGSI